MMLMTCVASIDNCGERLPLHPHHPHLSTHLLHFLNNDDNYIDGMTCERIIALK